MRVAYADELQQTRTAHADELQRASTELQQAKAAVAALGERVGLGVLPILKQSLLVGVQVLHGRGHWSRQSAAEQGEHCCGAAEVPLPVSGRAHCPAPVPLRQAEQAFDPRGAGWGGQHPPPCGCCMSTKLMQCRCGQSGQPLPCWVPASVQTALASRLLAEHPCGAPGGSPSCSALQSAGLMSTFLSHFVQVAIACDCPLTLRLSVQVVTSLEIRLPLLADSRAEFHVAA